MKWSLTAKANTFVHSHAKNVDWRCFLDSIFLHSKINQKEADQSTLWNVHSNPNNPEIFLVNALAVYILRIPRVLLGMGNFTVSAQYTRYRKVISEIIK